MLAVTMTGVVFLVFDIVVNRTAAVVSSTLTILVLTSLWVVIPLVGGERDEATDL